MLGRGARRRLGPGALATAIAGLLVLGACSNDDDATAADAADTARPAGTTPTTAPTATIERFSLDNGLEVILYPVAGAESTASLVAFDVGEGHDPPLQSGLAHLSEQVFSTAASGLVPPRSADEYAGLYPAGWTSETGDNFSITGRVFPSPDLERELGEAAARMVGLTITQEDVDRERARVQSDIDEILAADPAVAARTRAEELIQPSPNGGNEGGIPAQVALLDLAAVTDRITRFYKPANATLVLVGGFEPAAARAAVEANFGPVAAGQEVGLGAPWGLAGFGETVSVVVAPREGPGMSTASVGYLAPAPEDPTYPAFLTHVARMRAAGPDSDMTVGYAPLKTPGVVTISTPVGADESDDAAVERIRSWVATEVALPMTDEADGLVHGELAELFGVGGYPDDLAVGDPFRVALRSRTTQLDIDVDALTEALAELDDDDLAASVSATFAPDRSAAAVVLVDGA